MLLLLDEHLLFIVLFEESTALLLFMNWLPFIDMVLETGADIEPMSILNDLPG
jgi:hypothetical protein